MCLQSKTILILSYIQAIIKFQFIKYLQLAGSKWTLWRILFLVLPPLEYQRVVLILWSSISWYVRFSESLSIKFSLYSIANASFSSMSLGRSFDIDLLESVVLVRNTVRLWLLDIRYLIILANKVILLWSRFNSLTIILGKLLVECWMVR